MSTHAKPFAVTGDSVQSPAESSAAGFQSGDKEIEASSLEVPIRVLGYRATRDSSGEPRKGEAFEEDSTTLLLFPRGAVIQLKVPVLRGQDLMLINKQSNRYAHCRVTNIRTAPDASYVEIEFTHNIADFWGISFPGNAAAAANAFADFAAQLPTERLTNEREEKSVPPPAKALAAAAGIAGAKPGAISQAHADDGAGTIATSQPNAPVETEEQPSAPQFFAARPMECIPVCEPVVEPGERPAGVRVETEPTAQMVKWEPLSTPEPQSKRSLGPAALGAAVCAILLTYHFFAPAEAAMSIDPPDATSSSAENSQTAGAASAAAGSPRRSDSEEPSSVVVVSASTPEIDVPDAPRRVVLVSGMTVAAPNRIDHAGDAPELRGPTGEEQLPSPGNGAGLLGSMRSAPLPPPKPEPAAENPEKAEESLTPAQLLASVQPTYPPAARQAQIQGDVVIEATIDASGNVTAMKVLSGPQALRAAATTAVAKWKFQPAVLRGQPTASSSIVKLQFHLR